MKNDIIIKNLFLIILSFLYSENEIEHLINGKYNENISIENIKEEERSFLKGLYEVEGEKSVEYFIEYYNSNDVTFREEAIMKIAEYYYSRGSYLQSSNWYKKITVKYPDSKYIDTAVNYYINSLMIIGEKDSAIFYSEKFNDKYKHLNFNEAFLNKSKSKNKNNNNETIYSVQVGSYRDFQKAKKRKRILSREGFLCRIDEVKRGYDTFYSVRIGNFKNRSLANKEQKRLKYRIGIYDSIIIKIN